MASASVMTFCVAAAAPQGALAMRPDNHPSQMLMDLRDNGAELAWPPTKTARDSSAGSGPDEAGDAAGVPVTRVPSAGSALAATASVLHQQQQRQHEEEQQGEQQQHADWPAHQEQLVQKEQQEQQEVQQREERQLKEGVGDSHTQPGNLTLRVPGNAEEYVAARLLQQLKQERRHLHREEWPLDPSAATPSCQQDSRGQRAGCKGGCACGWREHCYSYKSAESPFEDTGVCDTSIFLMVGTAVAFNLFLLAATVAARIELQAKDFLAYQKKALVQRKQDIERECEQMAALRRTYKLAMASPRSRWPDLRRPCTPASPERRSVRIAAPEARGAPKPLQPAPEGEDGDRASWRHSRPELKGGPLLGHESLAMSAAITVQ